MPRYDYDPNDMDVIERGGNRFGWGNITFDDLVSHFDVSKFPDWTNGAEPYLAYIIMSRPDLNLSSQNIQVLANHTMTSGFFNDSYGQQLMYSMSNSSRNGNSNSYFWLPIITTRAMSYQTVDVNIKTVEKGQTFYGHVIKYGKHSEEHKVGGSFTIDFRNDRFLSIIKMMYLWMCYIWLVSKTGEIEPIEGYQQNGVLDYVGSVYYLVTKRNGRELVYWEKLTGVFPKTAPFSIFSYSDDFILNDRVSIEFDYGVRSDPNDPEVLIDINFLSGYGGSRVAGMSYYDLSNKKISAMGFENEKFVRSVGLDNIAFVNSLEQPFALGNSFAEAPFVHVVRQVDGTLRYYLDWIKTV